PFEAKAHQLGGGMRREDAKREQLARLLRHRAVVEDREVAEDFSFGIAQRHPQVTFDSPLDKLCGRSHNLSKRKGVLSCRRNCKGKSRLSRVRPKESVRRSPSIWRRPARRSWSITPVVGPAQRRSSNASGERTGKPWPCRPMFPSPRTFAGC